jgi:hypothetical protein
MRTCGTLCVISIFMAVLACAANGGTIYVDASATGANNGSSWTDAFVYLQDALAVAVDGNDIWVAAGTYKPDHGAGITIGDINATFELKAGVAMYGGFPIGGGTWQQRDPNIHSSILSGDLNGDDQPGFVNYAENSKIICRISWREGTTTLDGFTIEAAYDYALYNYLGGGGQIIVVNCKFLNQNGFAIALLHPDIVGDGVYLGTLGGSEIRDCVFENNRGGAAGGTNLAVLYLSGYSPVLKNCIFRNNKGIGLNMTGYQAWPDDIRYSNPTVINCHFLGNGQSGILVRGECSPIFVNCVIAANDYYGIRLAGMSGLGEVTLTNCMITNNLLGGISCKFSAGPSVIVCNSIVWENGDSSASAQIYFTPGSRVNLYSCCIQDGNQDGIYVNSHVAAAYNCIDYNPQFIRNPNDGGDGWGVGNNDDYGDLHLRYNSPCVDTGDNALVPADANDLDGDGNTSEPMPFDLDSRARILDGDCNSVATVDMGAYEFSYLYLGDFNGGCNVDFADFAVLASAWLTTDGQAGWNGNFDIALPADGIIDEKELEILVNNWLLGK